MLDLALTEATVLLINTKTIQGRLNALRDIKESRGIKSRTTVGQVYDNNSTVCLFVSLYVGYVSLVSLCC